MKNISINKFTNIKINKIFILSRGKLKFAIDNKKLKKLNRKLKEEINYYEDKHIYKPTTNSYVYILKKNILIIKI